MSEYNDFPISKIKSSDIPQLAERYPKDLYIKGNLIPENKFVTVVGSRKFTSYGKNACEKILSELSGHPVTIVSGLAIGIDSLAHKFAMKYKLHTIAIPGSGLDEKHLYPASNMQLAMQILNSNGALLSMFPPKTKAMRHTFPMRNELMALIADMVLIIEAGAKSGTMITARLATDAGATIGAVPRSIFDTNFSGANSLIKQGAHPITSGKDILELLHLEDGDTEKQEALFLTDMEAQILRCLNEPLSKNELAQMLEVPVQKISVAVATLELRQIVKEELGKIYKLK